MRRTLIWMSCLLAVACDRGDPCALSDEASMQLGQGENTFAPLAPGDLLRTEYGTQGGKHAWIAVRLHGIDPGRPARPQRFPGPEVRAELLLDDILIGAALHESRPLRGDPEQADVLDLRLVLDTWEAREAAADDTDAPGDTGAILPDEALLSVTVDDACGTHLEDAIEVRWR